MQDKLLQSQLKLNAGLKKKLQDVAGIFLLAMPERDQRPSPIVASADLALQQTAAVARWLSALDGDSVVIQRPHSRAELRESCKGSEALEHYARLWDQLHRTSPAQQRQGIACCPG